MTHGYTRQNDSDEGRMVLQRKSSNSIFGGDIETLQVQIDESSNEMLRIKVQSLIATYFTAYLYGVFGHSECNRVENLKRVHVWIKHGFREHDNR